MLLLLSNPELWKGISSILWPIATLIIFFASKSIIKTFFTKEQIVIEVAGIKLSIADAAKNIGKDLADLQQKVAIIEQSESKNTKIEPLLSETHKSQIEKKSLSLIWVDDFPSNNAFLVDRLQQDGINIELSLSTSDAISKIKARNYNAVISDLGRKEDNQDKPMAGLDLIKSIRGQGNGIPILIFAGRRGLENKPILIEAGADAVTASGTEVVKFVRDIQVGAQGRS